MENCNGIIVVSSRQVAEDFGKQHKNVIQSIENITAENSALTPVMFIPSTYKAGTGKPYPEYLMNRDGFSLLVMGFTGSAALQWKLKYIETFNKMESVIKKVSAGEIPYAEETKRIRTEAMLLNAKTRAFKAVKAVGNDMQLSAVAYKLYGLSAIENLLGAEIGRIEGIGKIYTATEIGNSVHKSSQAIGKLAKAHDLQTEEYGIWALDKSPYSAKQVRSFRYNEKGRAELLRLCGK